MSTADPSFRYDVSDFTARAARLDRPDGVEDGDFRFNTDLTDLIRQHATREAAVLIGITDRDGEAHMLLTQRTKALRAHSGQVAFPGGRIDPDDASAAEAARRECEEEIGIERGHLNVVGELPVYLSGSGYRIHPVLAVIEGDPPMRANPNEVDAIFEVPLSHVIDPANYRMGSRVWNGKRRYFYEMAWGQRHIWGVTAGIIRVMQERLYP